MELAESITELDWVGANELCTLFSMQHKVELGDGLHLKGLACLPVIVCLHSAEDDVLVRICTSGTLILWFKTHARPTSRRPEIYDHAMVCANDCLKLHERSNLANFTKLRCCRHSSWGPLSCTTVGTLVLLHLLHHLLHGRVVLHHLLHGWIVLHHLLHPFWCLSLTWLLLISTL